jgi:ubiquinone/menaquinone biosynthesis C-methylase UbiE
MTNVNIKVIEGSKFVEDCYVAQTKAFSRLEFADIQELILKNDIKSVLDVGTGEGNFIKGLASLFPAINFTAIDADPRLISIAGQKNKKQNILFKSLVFDQSFPAEEYDLILARFSVEHMPDVPGFISEAYRRLNNKGLLFITEYYIDDLHSNNEVWKLFKQKEFEFYSKFGSHPGISLELPKYFSDSHFSDIDSKYRYISPSIVGREAFYKLIITYANLYNNLECEVFTAGIKTRIIDYCNLAIKECHHEDGFLISHTIGRKVCQ